MCPDKRRRPPGRFCLELDITPKTRYDPWHTPALPFAICWGLGISCTLRDSTDLPYICPIARPTAPAYEPGVPGVRWPLAWLGHLAQAVNGSTHTAWLAGCLPPLQLSQGPPAGVRPTRASYTVRVVVSCRDYSHHNGNSSLITLCSRLS